MGMADFLLGIDYGTGGAKACIIDTQGQVLGFAFTEYPFYHDKPGWSEHDPALYWTIACAMIHDGRPGAHHPGEIRGVAVSSALPSLVMVDRSHNPIHRAYNLMDRRATAQVAWLKEHVGEARIQHSPAIASRITRPSSICCGKRKTVPMRIGVSGKH